MKELALLYLTCILAGFGLANVPTSAVITPQIASFFDIIGGIAIIIFGIALLHLGVKTLLRK